MKRTTLSFWRDASETSWRLQRRSIKIKSKYDKGNPRKPHKEKAWSIQFYGCWNLQWLWVARNPSLAYKLSLRQVNRITCPRRCHEVAVLRSQIICRMGFKKCIRGKTKPWAKKGFRSKKFEDFFAVWCACNDAGLQPAIPLKIFSEFWNWIKSYKLGSDLYGSEIFVEPINTVRSRNDRIEPYFGPRWRNINRRLKSFHSNLSFDIFFCCGLGEYFVVVDWEDILLWGIFGALMRF